MILYQIFFPLDLIYPSHVLHDSSQLDKLPPNIPLISVPGIKMFLFQRNQYQIQYIVSPSGLTCYISYFLLL